MYKTFSYFAGARALVYCLKYLVSITLPRTWFFPVKKIKDKVVYTDETSPINANVIMNNSVKDKVWLTFLIPFLYSVKQFSNIFEKLSSCSSISFLCIINKIICINILNIFDAIRYIYPNVKVRKSRKQFFLTSILPKSKQIY